MFFFCFCFVCLFVCLFVYYSAAPRSKEAKVTYTDSYVTLIWADGVNRTPPILFSHNPKLRSTSYIHNYSKRFLLHQYEATQRLTELLHTYGIPDRTVYVMPPTQNDKGTTPKKQYCNETKEMIEKALLLWHEAKRIPEGSLILSDAGNAMETAIFTGKGYKHHTYTPCVHHFLSPNDNCFHHTARAAWRKGRQG
jgi:hypothetical protein